MFMGLLLLFILTSVTFVSSDIVFKKFSHRPNTLPYISGYTHVDIVKRTEITSGKVDWTERDVYVAIHGRAYGVGVGEGTLINLNVLGKPTIPTHEDGTDNIWEKREDNGSWKKGYDTLQYLRQLSWI